MKPIERLRNLGIAMAESDVGRKLTQRIARKWVEESYPGNLHSREWAYSKVLIFYDSRVTENRIWTSDHEHLGNRTSNR